MPQLASQLIRASIQLIVGKLGRMAPHQRFGEGFAATAFKTAMEATNRVRRRARHRQSPSRGLLLVRQERQIGERAMGIGDDGFKQPAEVVAIRSIVGSIEQVAVVFQDPDQPFGHFGQAERQIEFRSSVVRIQK